MNFHRFFACAKSSKNSKANRRQAMIAHSLDDQAAGTVQTRRG
jgi:hypothetical protein